MSVEHGTRTKYGYGCRCDKCRAANADYQRRRGFSHANRRARRAGRVEIDGRLVHPNPYGGHGTLSAYNSCGCHCVPCTQAKLAHNRAYLQRTRST